MQFAIRIFAAGLLMLATLPSVRADWINLTGAETAPNIAEITFLDDRIHVALEIYVQDILMFEDLVPDDWLTNPSADRLPAAARLERFSREILQVIGESGDNLKAELLLAEPRLRKDRASPFAGMVNPVTRRKIGEPPADKRVLYVELDYAFTGKPSSITIVPPLDEEGRAKTNIGFIAYHKAVPIIDFRYLSRSVTVRLDWDDPWYSKFDNPNLKRHHKSALMSFLYVEPREVRHEILIRVRDLEDWADLELRSRDEIVAERRDEIKARANEFLRHQNPVKIDGTIAELASIRAEFLEISLTGLQVIDDRRTLDRNTAMLGVILSYPVDRMPDLVSVDWQLFNDRNTRVPATSIDPAGPLLGYVEPGDSVLEWRNHLLKYEEPGVSPVPIERRGFLESRWFGIVPLSLAVCFGLIALIGKPTKYRSIAGLSAVAFAAAGILIGAGQINVRDPFSSPPDNAIAARIVESIITNISRAYLERDGEDRRDKLAIVIANAGFGDVRSELDRALAIKVAGGGIATVDAIEELLLEEISALGDGRGFRSVAEWTARASAGHWGHQHRTAVRFRALIELVEDEGDWKLSGITVVDARKLG